MKKTYPPAFFSESDDNAAAASTDQSSSLMPPPGMRDLLPPESRARRKVSVELQRVFERYGYELVTTPLFERVEVFERGLMRDPRDLMRFVEPESGDIVALRPDMTPQVARVVATRLGELPGPFRIRYEGTVIRRRRGRARRQRQIAQVGIELIGLAGSEADAEVVRSVAEAVSAAGLRDYRIELSEVGVGRALLAEHGDVLFAQATEALAHKDEGRLLWLLAQAGVSTSASERIVKVLHLHGDLSVLAEAKRLVAGTPAAPHLDALERVTELLFDMGLGTRLGVDLGEIRGAGYYTGVSFGLFARGPGEAVASGGRYDQLLARYGKGQPATGAAIDVENLLWALDAAGEAWRADAQLRLVVAGDDAHRVRALADALRAHDYAVSSLPGAGQEAAVSYASAWGLDACLLAHASGALCTRSADKAQRELVSELSRSEVEALAAWVRGTRKE